MTDAPSPLDLASDDELIEALMRRFDCALLIFTKPLGEDQRIAVRGCGRSLEQQGLVRYLNQTMDEALDDLRHDYADPEPTDETPEKES